MFDAVELFKNPLEWSFCSLCQCNLKVNNPEKHFKKVSRKSKYDV